MGVFPTPILLMSRLALLAKSLNSLSIFSNESTFSVFERISVGKDNPYGHPHPEVLETLDKYGIRILRTDLNGDIKILCDSQSLKLKSKE